MSSYLRSDRRKARRRLLIATVIVVALFALDILSGGFFRGIARTASMIVWSAGSRIESAVFGSGYFSSRRSLQTENDALKQKIIEFEVETAEIETLKNENAELREVVHLAESTGGITAPIVSSVRSSPYGTFMVGAGTAEGISAGSMVMAGGGRSFVIGRITEAGEHSSLVKEVFAPGVSAEGELRGAVLLFEGQGGGNARAKAPRTLSVAEGDSVTSALFGGRLIGVVGAVSSDSGSAYQSVYVRTPVNLSKLQFVYVVPNR
ncbi:rod shape-determining protein MreC [Candidatus Kaiserbacteria bacterium]|nr:rod shape-determining protein MreC [Candidatus Kaiserbacteria bacterium]